MPPVWNASDIHMLQVLRVNILACGTIEPLADVATQTHLSDQVTPYLEPVPESTTPGDWAPVYGELLTFDALSKPPCRHRPA